MHFSSAILAAGALLSTVSAQNGYKGFNYGAFFNNQQAKTRADFEYEFKAAKLLPGTNGGFTSARLYTMIQWGTQTTVIEAIQAAINTKTTLLLGMWASSGQANINNEITALKAAIQQYGKAFTDLVVGISVGSEDLYRITPTGIQNKAGAGAQPNELLNYIRQTKAAIKGTGLQGKPVGHVDTWTAYVNASNNAVIAELDFLGVDAYPYFQTTMANSIENANQTFYDAFKATIAASQGKPVWVTETGWPVTGPQQNQAVASANNARIYWEDVACSLMAKNVNFYYYMLQEAQYGSPSPDFGIKGAGDLNQLQPRFDLRCSSLPESSSSSETPTATSLEIPITPTTPPEPVVMPPPASPPVSPPPISLDVPFTAPHVMVPVDRANPDLILGSQFIARVSSTLSTLFNFDVPPELAGKTCNLVFHLPPVANEWWQPYSMTAPGGITLSRLEKPAVQATMFNTVGLSQPMGSVPQLAPGQSSFLGSAPCEAGNTVGYQVDGVDDLHLEFLQLSNPPTGLFMTVSG